MGNTSEWTGAQFRIRGTLDKDVVVREGKSGSYAFAKIECIDGDYKTWIEVALFGPVCQMLDGAGKGTAVEISGKVSNRKSKNVAPEGRAIYETKLIGEAAKIVGGDPVAMVNKAFPRNNNADSPF